jgi:hypothetical protein
MGYKKRYYKYKVVRSDAQAIKIKNVPVYRGIAIDGVALVRAVGSDRGI